MEELNNHQIVLLTMFVSFVVSIATGIITVAMLEEAPPTLTQTVNRVVEHTIERVVTGTSTQDTTKTPTVVTNVTKEVTVYAKEDDLVVAAVEKNQSRMAKILLSGAATSSNPRAVGFVVSRDGLIVTETDDLLAGSPSTEEAYAVIIAGKRYTAKPVSSKSPDEPTLSFLKISGLSASTTLDAVSFGRNENPKLGQTIIVMGGSDGESVFKTTVSKFRTVRSLASSTPDRSGAELETTPAIPAHNAGALVVNLDGQAVGIAITDPDTATGYVICPVSCILALINSFGSTAP